MERFLCIVVTVLFISCVTSTILIRTPEGDEIAFKPIKQLIAHKQHILSKFKPANYTSHNANATSNHTSTNSATNPPNLSSTSSPLNPPFTMTQTTSNVSSVTSVTSDTSTVNTAPSMNESNLSTDTGANNEKITTRTVMTSNGPGTVTRSSTFASPATLRLGESDLVKPSPFDPYGYTNSYPNLIYPYPYMPPITSNSPQIPHNIILIPMPFPPSIIHNPSA